MTDKKPKRKTSTATRRVNKNATKPRAKKRSSKPKKTRSKPTWLRRIWSLVWKIGLASFTVLVLGVVYLDSLVRERFEGQLFELPTVVYARVLTLLPGDELSIQEVRNELDVLNYRKVRQPKFPGEYSASSSKIELIRRPFEFSDGPEPDRHVMLHFDSSGLSRIQSLEQRGDLGYLRIEPKMLGMLEKEKLEQRLFLKRNQFPELLVDALLITEDRDFYKHEGVSPLAIVRAFVTNIQAGRTVQGGSTLTQQLAKNMFLSSERTLWRKVREALIALIIEHRYDKDRILEAYLNEVFLGQHSSGPIHGFGLGARFYFGQPIEELRIDQLALLVGLVKGPSYYNPVRRPERAKQRRDLILRLLMDHDLLTARQFEQAASRPLDVSEKPSIAPRRPAYFDQVRNELNRYVGEDFQSGKGLRVFTSLDPVSQQMLENSVRNKVPHLSSKHGKALQAAAVAVDRNTGEIRAMVGGTRTGFDGFNRALNGRRQIGSLAKPAVYLTALAEPDRFHLATTLSDEPMTLRGQKSGDVWSPQNYDNQFRGPVPLYQSLARSYNVPTVQLGMEVGIGSVVDTLVGLGVPSKEIRAVPSMFLGAFSLSPIEVAQMYQTLSNSGRKASLSALRSVLDRDGKLIYESIPRVAQRVNEQAAWLTMYALKKSVEEGTSRILQRDFSSYHLAGKTGTSNEMRDSWFVGVDGREVTTIWVGRDDNGPTDVTGSRGALRVYHDYLKQRGPQRLQIPRPPKIINLGTEANSDGKWLLTCDAENLIPVWDHKGQLARQCSRSNNWINRLLDW